MNLPLRPLAALALVAALVAPARAVDPTGSWLWKETTRGVEREWRLGLILKPGNRVVGGLIITGARGDRVELEVLNGRFEFDVVTFTTERDFNGQKQITKFRGKVLGAHIAGTIEALGSTGFAIARDWSARKVM